jgi:predicted phosphodiesterase
MKTAILSDIHGNVEAFFSVLQDINLCRITRIFCLGDCIGYGPEPNKVLKIIEKLNISTVMGNHEMAMLKPSFSSWFNPIAKESLRKTRKMLNASAMDQISRFPHFKIYRQCRLVHGFPPDLSRMYLFQASEEKLLATFQRMPESICFLGHTHQLELIEYDGKGIRRKALEKVRVYLDENYHYIINVGSVGQPRDGNNNAKYVIWDESAKSIEVRYVPYDIASTVAKIKRAGLPKAHGNRLWC